MSLWKPALAVFAFCALGCVALEFSPDGKTIVLAWPLEKDMRLATIGADGTGFRYIAADEAVSARWSPDGTRIASLSDKGLKVLDPTSGESRLVVPDAAGGVAWSSNGRKLATLVPVESSTDRFEVVWYDLDARGITLRSRTPPIDLKSEASLVGFVWIPDSSGLAFLADSPSGSDVYLMEFGETRKLTTTGDVVGLALMPGRRLVWARRSRNPKYILLTFYAFDLVERSVRRLPFPERVPGVNPGPRTGPESVDLVLFAPDLSRMLVWASLEGGAGAVYCVDRDGKRAFVLGSTAKDSKVESLLFAAWSPDGKQIASLWTSDRTTRLQIQDSDGSGARTLRTHRSPPAEPRG